MKLSFLRDRSNSIPSKLDELNFNTNDNSNSFEETEFLKGQDSVRNPPRNP